MRKYGLLFLACVISSAEVWAINPPRPSSLLRAGKVFSVSQTWRNVNRAVAHALRPSVSARPDYRLPIESPRLTSPERSLAATSSLLDNAAMQYSVLQRPTIKPLEENIHRFIFTLSPRQDPSQALGSGFVFAQTRADGSLRLWGATTAQIAEQTGPDVLLTFRAPNAQTFSFPARVVMQGRTFGSNAALIEVPEEISQVALPVDLSTTKPTPRFRQDTPDASLNPTQLFTHSCKEALAYGFHTDGHIYKIGMAPFSMGSERLLAHTPQEATLLDTEGGLMVDGHGRALGIYNRAYDASEESLVWLGQAQRKSPLEHISYVSEFIPIKHLEYLLREYETPHSADRVVLFDGINVGKMALNETILQMEVYYNNGTPVVLDKSPLWSLYDLNRFVPDIDHATKVHIHVAGPDGQYAYTFAVDLEKRKSYKLEDMLWP